MYHLNQLVTGTQDPWMPVADWEACAGDPVFRTDLRTYCAVRIAHDHRAAAVAVAQRQGERVALRVRSFPQASLAGGEYLPASALEDHLRDLRRRYPAPVLTTYRARPGGRELSRGMPGPEFAYQRQLLRGVGAGASTGAPRAGRRAVHARAHHARRRVLADANPDKFVTILNLYEFWDEQTGQPLLITGLVARREWFDGNFDQANAIVAGLDAAVEWMTENADALLEPPYEEWMEGAGLLSDPRQTELFLERVRAGTYFTTSSLYTQAWIDNQYTFIENGVGVFIETVPPKETIFATP